MAAGDVWDINTIPPDGVSSSGAWLHEVATVGHTYMALI